MTFIDPEEAVVTILKETLDDMMAQSTPSEAEGETEGQASSIGVAW